MSSATVSLRSTLPLWLTSPRTKLAAATGAAAKPSAAHRRPAFTTEFLGLMATSRAPK